MSAGGASVRPAPTRSGVTALMAKLERRSVLFKLARRRDADDEAPAPIIGGSNSTSAWRWVGGVASVSSG